LNRLACALKEARGTPARKAEPLAAIPSGAPEIFALDRVEIAVEPWRWDFAVTRRAQIDRYFADRQRERPALWNGRVLMVNRYEINGAAMLGACFETDYASYLAWRDWEFPDASVFNIFASAALRASDGAYLVGEMAQSTANAGSVYFPCGTPDPKDIGAGGALDLPGSLSRELYEETGLDVAAFNAAPDWRLVRDRGFLALIKELRAREDAHTLRSRIMRRLADQAQPEFTDIRIIRGSGDLDPQMPRYVVAFLEQAWRK
jgi:8-oxo-dGTP pyrophosphatase MutT (NUDIX family)